MTIDSTTGLVQWQPKNEDAGESTIQVAVYNMSEQMALQSFRLKVDADLTPPPDIQNLKADTGDKKVSLSWAPCQDIEDLADQILYINNGQGYGEGISLSKTTGQYTVSGLKNGQKYTFRITAKDILGNENSGVIVSATPKKDREVIRAWWQFLDPWYYQIERSSSLYLRQYSPFWFPSISRDNASDNRHLMNNQYYYLISPYYLDLIDVFYGNFESERISNWLFDLNSEQYLPYWQRGGYYLR